MDQAQQLLALILVACFGMLATFAILRSRRRPRSLPTNRRSQPLGGRDALSAVRHGQSIDRRPLHQLRGRPTGLTRPGSGPGLAILPRPASLSGPTGGPAGVLVEDACERNEGRR